MFWREGIVDHRVDESKKTEQGETQKEGSWVVPKDKEEGDKNIEW